MLTGETVVITGASSGVGLEAAIGLARMGACLNLIVRDPDRGTVAADRIAQHGPKPRLFLADLSLQADVRRVAHEILASVPRIGVLINNAGAWFNTRQVTADALERTFALNHMGYFLLTCLLLERIAASAPARVVSVSSDGHAEAMLDFDDLQTEVAYSGRKAYCRSKLANVLFTRALSRRLAGTGITANCLHPGRVRTRFFETVIPSVQEREALWERLSYVPPAEGAGTLIFVAASPNLAGVSGEYFENCTVTQPSEAARDELAAERLWSISKRLAGLHDASSGRRIWS